MCNSLRRRTRGDMVPVVPVESVVLTAYVLVLWKAEGRNDGLVERETDKVAGSVVTKRIAEIVRREP